MKRWQKKQKNKKYIYRWVHAHAHTLTVPCEGKAELRSLRSVLRIFLPRRSLRTSFFGRAEDEIDFFLIFLCKFQTHHYCFQIFLGMFCRVASSSSMRFSDTAFIVLYCGKRFVVASLTCYAVYAKSNTILDIQWNSSAYKAYSLPTTFWYINSMSNIVLNVWFCNLKSVQLMFQWGSL